MNGWQRGCCCVIGLILLLGAASVRGDGPPPQPAAMVLNEAQMLYLANLARADQGIPPLRWNRQLTEAARWFSWDSVENRATPYCGNVDTLGRTPWDRMEDYGYSGSGVAENVWCSYGSPQAVIAGWLGSPVYRDNLLDPDAREAGTGYYRRSSDGRGYVTLDLANDAICPPVIMDHEALTATSPSVQLYIYDRQIGTGFAGMDAATEMMVSNDPCFADASWEPYAANRDWTLEPGTGWRTVYVQTRDAVGRISAVSDSIYLGADLPMEELDSRGTTTSRSRVTLYDLDGGGLPSMQFSQHWFVDDTFPSFELYYGNGERVTDPDARGGTSYRLYPGNGNSFAWVWTTTFYRETPFVAYLRLRVSSNSPGEVLRAEAIGGGISYGLTLDGSDFAAPNTYQDFPLPFTFHDNPDDVFLIFQFLRTGSADVYIDGVYIFGAPQPLQSPFTWTVPGANYRGGGVWVRYTDGGEVFSEVEEATRLTNRLDVEPAALGYLVEHGSADPLTRTLTIRQRGCAIPIQVTATPVPWLNVQHQDGEVEVGVTLAGLITGTYQAAITVTAEGPVEGSPAVVPVTLVIADRLQQVYLPLILRAASGLERQCR